MAQAKGAFISVDEIVNSWLLKRGKTIHSYYRALVYAAECVRELALTTIAPVQHTILQRDAGTPWWELPAGYTDWVNVGVQVGGYYRRVGVTDRLIPVPGLKGSSEFNNEFGPEAGGQQWASWAQNGQVDTPASFNKADFAKKQLLTAPFSKNVVPNNGNSLAEQGLFSLGDFMDYGYGWRYSGMPTNFTFGFGAAHRVDEVCFNPEAGVIMCNPGWGATSLFLSYIGVGNIDTMSNVPLMAQATVMAYIDWQWQKNKRRGENVVGLEVEFDKQHRILRARKNDITTTDLIRSVNYPAYSGSGYGGGVSSYSQIPPLQVVNSQSNDFNIVLDASNSTTTTITSQQIAGNVLWIAYGNQQYNTGDFSQNGTTITLTNGNVLTYGLTVTIHTQQ